MDYYVYLHRRASDNTVFYVGKGSGRRAWSRKRTIHWKRVVAKHGLIVEIYQSGLQEWYAYELEEEMILRYGLMRDGGVLINKMYSNSQLNQSYNIRLGLPLVQYRSTEQRKKISSTLKLYFQTHGSPIKGVPKSEETKQKLSVAHLGIGAKGKNPFAKRIKCVDTGVIFESVVEAIEWLKSIGHAKANRHTLFQNRHKTYKGFKWEYLGKE